MYAVELTKPEAILELPNLSLNQPLVLRVPFGKTGGKMAHTVFRYLPVLPQDLVGKMVNEMERQSYESLTL